jgi:two-component sensor histidine kinase
VAKIDDRISEQSALTESDRSHILELLAEWQLLSDLSFADLILWIPKRKDYQTWPTGYIAMSHIRPTTAATVFPNDELGTEISWGVNQRIDQALKTGEIDRDTDPELKGDIWIKEEIVPVFHDGRVIAVISRHRNAELMRSPSKLELNYREIAHKIYQMLAEGNFPFQNSIYRAESAPRVGDGLIRLDANGLITYASPNGRSALNRAGYNGELEGVNLGEIINSVKPVSPLPTDESWKLRLNGKVLRRDEFENLGGSFDLLVIPLIEKGQHIGAIALIHNVTELRRKDRALVSKDATIKEIHHRVKNNLQTVSALLRLQSRRVDDPSAQAALNEAVRRVASIAIVHETLAISSAESVDFDQVFDRIIHNAIELSSREIKYEKLGKFGVFDSQKATPLALIITELIHNALEHGLEKDGDKLIVEINRNANNAQVKVIDNGVGLPAGFDIDSSSNLGLQIVKTLTENELKGNINLTRNGNQTEAVLSF